jgi:hypothetical protein
MSYASRWESAPAARGETIPAELIRLKESLRSVPPAVRAKLEPLVDDALEQAKFRGRAMAVARDGLERLKLELELARFDLEVTRREREDLKRRVG